MAHSISRKLALLMALSTLLISLRAHGQTELPRLAISALWSDGTRLLVGQGATLYEVLPSGESLTVRWQRNLARGALQAITVCAPFIFALSADGLSVLAADGRELAFGRGGGHRLACNADQVWVAALGAGVRRYQVGVDGRLTAREPIRTTAAAHDVIPSDGAFFWVAESTEGVRLYDFEGTVRLWLNAFTSAQVVRYSSGRLFIGHGAQLSILAVGGDGSAPQVIGAATLSPNDAHLADLVVVGNRLYVGRVHASGRGASLIAFDFFGVNTLRVVGQFGEDGGGARLGQVGTDIFVTGGSSFSRVRFDGETPTLITSWLAAERRCTLNVPTDPQPADGAQVAGNTLTLSWRASCAESFEVRVDGALIATLIPAAAESADSESDRPQHSQIVQLSDGEHTWQVLALGADRMGVASPMWRFEVTSEGLAETAAAPRGERLYHPPFLDLQTPAAALAALCAASCGGLLLIIAAAWWLGVRAQRRWS
jgi:hypothetical protein